MQRWLRLASKIDRVTDRIGIVTAWMIVVMTLIGAYNAVVRYLGRYLGFSLSSNVYLELQWYIFSLIFLLGAGYALRHNAHVRVDVIYGHVSKRAQAWIDLFGTILLLVPFSLFVLYVSWPSVRNSWAILEGSPDPGGLARYPLKTFILVCFVLLLMQAVSQIIKEVGQLRGEVEPPDAETLAQETGL